MTNFKVFENVMKHTPSLVFDISSKQQLKRRSKKENLLIKISYGFALFSHDNFVQMPRPLPNESKCCKVA